MLSGVDRTARLRAKNNEPIRSGADRCLFCEVQGVILVGCDWWFSIRMFL